MHDSAIRIAAHRRYRRHTESTVTLATAAPERVFALLDNHTTLSGHMSGRSWLMGGGSMQTTFDEANGKSVGSHIVLSGRAFGVSLYVDEVVTLHEPPLRKVWETVGEPRLIVVGAYRMSFTIRPLERGSCLTVALDFDLPSAPLSRLLGQLFGSLYGRWCTRRMTTDASRALEG